MNELTKREEKRYEELYDKAVAHYLDKVDFDPIEWLPIEEQDEYVNLCNRYQGFEVYPVDEVLQSDVR